MMRRLLCALLALLLPIAPALALSPLSVELYAGGHFSFAVPEGWAAEEREDGLLVFTAPEESEFAGMLLTVEELDVSDYAPFDTSDLYAGIAASLGGEGTAVPVDGHSASLVEMTSETGCLCTVLYCRGTTVLAMSATAPEADAAAARTLLLNMVRYTAYLGA